MADFKNIGKDIENQERLTRALMTGKLQRIIAVEGKNHFDKSWDKEGFTDNSLKKWPKRQWGKAVNKKNGGMRKDYEQWKTKDKGRRLLMSLQTGTKKSTCATASQNG